MTLTLQTMGKGFPSSVYLEGMTMADLVRMDTMCAQSKDARHTEADSHPFVQR